MKTTWMVLVAMLVMGSVFGQGAKVPQAAKNDLKSRYPNATTAKWEGSGKGCEAEWTENGREVAVVYDARGKYVMTEREIDPSAVPAAVIKGINKAWPTAIVQEAENQTHADNRVTYQVELVQDGVGREVTLDAGGTVLNDGTNGSGDSDGADGSKED